MLAAIAPAAIRRVNGLRRVVPLPCVREWSSQGLQRADRAPLLVLWDSMVPRSRATASPLWSRFLSSSASGSGHGEGSDGSGKDGKEGEGGILDAAREDGALKEESGENEVVGETGKTEVSGEKLKEPRDDPKESTGEKEGSGAAELNNRSQHGAIVPALGPRPDRVVAVPLTRRPLFPGFYVPVSIKDQKLADKLSELKSAGTPWVGTFLLKDQKARTDGSQVLSTAEGGEGEILRGEELFKRLHEYGTFAQITNVMRPLDGEGATQILLMGHRRLRITGMLDTEPLSVGVDHLRDKPYDSTQDELKATILEVVTTMKDLMRLNPLYKEHIQMFVQHMGEFNASKLADFGAALTTADEPVLQEVLEELDVLRRLHLTLVLLKKEFELSKLQQSIAKGVEEKMTGDQRKYFLMEQLKAIKKELGLETDDKTALTAKFRERLEPRRKDCPPHVLQVIDEELNKLQGLESSSSEFNVTRNYLDWLTSLPWGHFSEENFDVNRAQKILDEEHYGLEDVKERILEFIAVGRLRGKTQGKIICLAGPPGVGKTSIGRSIAHALNRQFYRFSVGGLGDVAEIKGHRRTYVGAMPGKMVQCLKATGTSNPLVLIDEIDKLGRGHSGDPASALLELLDPEQNANFLDHYLDVPIDLSKVLFVCTANLVENIPGPLLDRMEVIRLVGYITAEKTHIARGYLEKAAREGSGVEAEQVDLSDGALHTLIETYCREAGVRNLQKHIERIYRKVALKLVRKELEALGTGKEVPLTIEEVPVLTGTATEMEQEGSAEKTSSDVVLVEEPKDVKEDGPVEPVEKLLINETNLPDYVGPPIFQSDRLYEQTPVGVVMGLAWTAMGGSTLYVETSLVEQGEGKGTLQMTGQLGDVMKESASIAHTLARQILREKEPENNFFANSRMHLHVPAGATPKDGPSAGCTMITSMLSLAMNMPVKNDVAMTGEVTLTGRVLPIGGVKEKTVAARRSGVKMVIFPSGNKRDYLELPAHVKEGLEVHFVDHYSEIFTLAFDVKPESEKQLTPIESTVVSQNDPGVLLHS
ncbi:lon protease homolog 1, mitochondrial [Physcomitrium patens]|uniref:Lon protease homolog, mitochondrial n=1 Tax=Physcomitrium patens TaxID=3218 RepID=A0A2K1JLT2_PHYPA|nr:lon protease homolog 1, mitochondrial-like [Physcomitrium patens]PNR42504.1 hypothetical protein PHYPA_017334 [Physcomitrium patens]|eukprot:XP_024392421.1 lon protease homolog 1, mitochondrial-like [Physcomitrella patens]